MSVFLMNHVSETAADLPRALPSLLDRAFAAPGVWPLVPGQDDQSVHQRPYLENCPGPCLL